MSAPKLITLFGLLGKAEASYNAGGTLTTGSDGILLADKAVAEIDYSHDGSRPLGPGTGGTMKRVAPKGRTIQVPFKVQARGAGSAYSATVLPRDLDVFLRMSGHKRVIDVTVGAEKVTYTPSSLRADWISGFFAAYAREQLWSPTGAYADVGWEIDGPGPMVFEFPTKANLGLPTDAALPAITYQDITVLPPIAESMVFNIGAFQTGAIRKASFKANRAVSGPRNSIVATGGVAGFGLGRRKPQLEVTLEATALVGSPFHTAAGLNPYELRDRATVLALGITLGATGAYNVVQFTANQAQIVKVGEEETDPEALWTLTFDLNASSPILDDEYSIVTSK